MNFERYLKEDITLWAVGAKDKYGERTFGAPTVIKGRWEDRVQQVVTPSGEDITSKTTVFLMQDVNVGDFLAKGDHTGASDPRMAGGSQVQSFIKLPDIRNVSHERKAYL